MLLDEAAALSGLLEARRRALETEELEECVAAPRGGRDEGAGEEDIEAGGSRHASDEFTNMTSHELRNLIEDRLERLAAEIGSYDVLAVALRRAGLDAAVEMLDHMRAATEAGETEFPKD